ncbi:MAG: hypothetical protein GY943_26205 [Chloroflexi bacterium]|nr:hypothetical protein [Chloroflexota bacterium]
MYKKLFVLLFILLLASCRPDPAPPSPTATAVPPSTPSATETAVPPTTTPISPTATAVPVTPTPIPLTAEQELANLIAFARLYGVVRYFHPSNQVAAIEKWDAVVINGIEAVQDARTPEELAQRLNTFFAPIAPTMLVTVGESTETAVFQPTALDTHQLIMWEHYGVAADSGHDLYTSERITESATNPPDNFHDPERPYSQPLGSGLTAYVPLTLYLKDGQTQPAIPIDMSIDNYHADTANQTRYVASAIMFWAVTQHFYPYFDVVDVDWNASLSNAIQSILNEDGLGVWESALKKLVVDLNDGHSWLNSNTPIYAPFVSLGWVEEQVVVLEAAGKAGNSLQPGDVILEVDGETAVNRLQEQMNHFSSPTPQFKQYRALSTVLGGREYTEVVLTVQRSDGSQEVINLERNTLAYPFEPQNRPANFSEVASGIFYIDLSRSNDETFEDKLIELDGTAGLIFDLRGYPSISTSFMELLISEPITSAQFLIPQTSTPNQENVTFDDGAWTLDPRNDAPLSQNIIFLTDGRAISYSETLLAMIKHHQVAEIVGEPSAGTNGNINRILLPTNHMISWTGMLVLNHDGSQHHGIGALPTIPISQTLSDLRNGIDTQLQAAIQLIEENR